MAQPGSSRLVRHSVTKLSKWRLVDSLWSYYLATVRTFGEDPDFTILSLVPDDRVRFRNTRLADRTETQRRRNMIVHEFGVVLSPVINALNDEHSVQPNTFPSLFPKTRAKSDVINESQF